MSIFTHTHRSEQLQSANRELNISQETLSSTSNLRTYEETRNDSYQDDTETPDSNFEPEKVEKHGKQHVLSRIRSRFSASDNWTWEILAITLALLTQVAIIIILARLDQNLRSNWNAPISINTAVATFSTISKSALLVSVTACLGQLKWHHFERAHILNDLDTFDRSSRGPWGALELLLQINAKAPLASLGAVIIVCALAIDPFTQQILAYPVKSVVSGNNTALFPISTSYYYPASFVGGSVGAWDPEMQGAVYSALFGHISAPNVTCTSANCTWPANTLSFGVTSKCVNVTQTVSKACSTYPNVNSLDFTNCTIITPRGILLETYAAIGSNYSAEWYQTTINTSSLPYEQQNRNGQNVEFFSFAIYQNNASTYTGELGGEIIECAFSWTEYHYDNISVIANKFQPGNSRAVPLAGNATGPDEPDLNYIFNSSDSSRQYNLSLGATGFWSFLETLFGGGFYTMQGIPSIFMGQFKPGLKIPAAQSFYNADVEARAANIADAMTERIRTGMNSTPVAGFAYEQAVFVHVRWPWLVLPLLLIFGAIILLILSILNGRRSEIPLWKSSGIALLFHAVSPWNEEKYSVNKTKDLETVADEMSVQLLLDKRLEFQVVDAASRDGKKGDRVALL